MSSPSFAEELRGRDDKSLAQLFAARPDLLSPVPSDLSALAARANSMPSLFRARDVLTQWQFDVLTAMALLSEPFEPIRCIQADTVIVVTVRELYNTQINLRCGRVASGRSWHGFVVLLLALIKIAIHILL